jgi:putative transposase
MGETNLLITPHLIYKALGSDATECLLRYRDLFNNQMADVDIEEIRLATNKAWVLGDGRFKEQIEKLTARQAKPKVRGGDRRSKDFKDNAFNRV